MNSFWTRGERDATTTNNNLAARSRAPESIIQSDGGYRINR